VLHSIPPLPVVMAHTHTFSSLVMCPPHTGVAPMSCVSYLGAQAVSTSHTASCVAYLPFVFSMLTSSLLLESNGTVATTASLQLWTDNKA
jgi:hypothetical protein